jgi:hypothetical protein
MKKIALFILSAVAFAACSSDIITYTEELASVGNNTAETPVTLDCSDFNSDIAVLQVLTAELLSGSCVMSVDGSTIKFDTGTTATVAVRESYGFEYANPAIGVSGRFWVINGTALETKVADALLQLKCEDGSWRYSLDDGADWSFLSDAEEGTNVPVFTSLTDNGTEVVVSLGSGNTFSFDYYEEDDD